MRGYKICITNKIHEHWTGALWTDDPIEFVLVELEVDETTAIIDPPHENALKDFETYPFYGPTGHVSYNAKASYEDPRNLNTFHKCRAPKAKVLKIHGGKEVAYSWHIASTWNWNGFEYKVGAEVIPDSFDEDKDFACGHGIHFFREKQQALDYVKRSCAMMNPIILIDEEVKDAEPTV